MKIEIPSTEGFFNGLTAAVNNNLLTAALMTFVVITIPSCESDDKERHHEVRGERAGESQSQLDRSRIAEPFAGRLKSSLARRTATGGLSHESMQLLQELATTNPYLALEAYTKDPKGMDYEGFPEVVALIAKHHPEFISEWLGSDLSAHLEDPDDRQTFVNFLLPALAAEDSNAAFDALHGLEARDFADQAAMNRLKDLMFARMGATDPELAVNQLTGRYNGRQLDAALTSVARAVSFKNIDHALAIIANISSPQAKFEGMALVLGASGRVDYSKIADAVDKLDGSDIMRLIRADQSGAFSETLYKNDLESVKRALETSVLTDQNFVLFSRYVEGEAANDPAAALDFVLSFPESPVRDRMLIPAFMTWSGQNVDAAINGLGQLEGNAKNEALKGVAQVAGARGMDFVAEISRNLDTDSRARFIASSIGAAINADFEGSLEYVNGSRFMKDTTSQEGRSAGVRAVSQTYAAKDPVAAFQWLGTLGEESQAQAMEAYAAERARTDIASLAEQLAGMPQDSRWKVGVEVLVANLRNSDPARAEQWANTLKGE